jgi:tetratricopeptide (TPR) repeat protein
VIEHSRINDLRRRIQEDPASLVFAELAEEYRRSGNNGEAVAICRAGLVHHPDDLTARVTLGRALIELNKLDEAFGELAYVLDASPGNLAAIRALAEIYQHRGMMSEALVHYRRALQLAEHDAELSERVNRIEQAATPLDAPVETPPSPAAIEELFNFDSLLAQLDATREVLAAPTFVPLRLPVATPLDAATPAGDDSFAQMERQLREREEQRLMEEKQSRQAEAERRRVAVLQELEGWLAAIAQDRRSHPYA